MPYRFRKLCILMALGMLAVAPRAGRAEPPPPAPAPAPLSVPAEPSDCDRRLSELAAYTRLPPIDGPGECGSEDLVRLEAVTMPDRSRVTLVPPATLRCSMAEAVVQFVRTEVGPAAAEFGAPLTTFMTAASFDCRNRNGQQAAKISEHARANALDVSAIRLANHAVYSLSALATPEPLRARVRDGACRFFTTVLGPGSDPFHAQHIHLDRVERHRGYRICQWELHPPEIVPLPLPKPAALVEPARQSK